MTSNEEEIKMSFLLSGSCDLPSSCIKLRSYLNTHLSNVADQNNLKLLKHLRNRNKTCPYCYSSWSPDTKVSGVVSFKLLPTKCRPLQQVDETVQEVRNTLVLKCKVCTKKSSFSLVKKKCVKDKTKEVVKTKNKSNSLVPNPKNVNYQSPAMLVKNKKSTTNSKETNNQNVQSSCKIPQTAKDNPDGTKKLVPNPFALQAQYKNSKKDRKLQKLKQEIKQNQGVAKKTLQDFLSLV